MCGCKNVITLIFGQCQKFVLFFDLANNKKKVPFLNGVSVGVPSFHPKTSDSQKFVRPTALLAAQLQADPETRQGEAPGDGQAAPGPELGAPIALLLLLRKPARRVTEARQSCGAQHAPWHGQWNAWVEVKKINHPLIIPY